MDRALLQAQTALDMAQLYDNQKLNPKDASSHVLAKAQVVLLAELLKEISQLRAAMTTNA